MASIMVAVGRQEGQFWPLGRRTTVIGRDEGLLVQILDDMVSRKHVKIRYDAESGRHQLVDMGSRNGVFVNNQRIASQRDLADGDVISIGGTSLMFTELDFEDRESALSHFKKVGERMRVTVYVPKEPGGGQMV